MKRVYAFWIIGVICLSGFFIANFSSAKTHTAIKDLDIYTIQPRLITEEFMPPSTLQDAAQKLTNKFTGHLKYSDIYQYKDIITTQSVKKFGQSQIILWRGHGSWDDENKQPIILTGRDFDETESEPNIIIQDGFYEAITPEYINKYVGDLSGSLIYLNVCESAHNEKLIEAFLKKGAETVIGSTNTLEMNYSNNIQDMSITLLGEINPTTNNYYTMGEALENAKNEYGAIDPGSGGKLVLFGNKNYRIATVAETPVTPLAPNTGSK